MGSGKVTTVRAEKSVNGVHKVHTQVITRREYIVTVGFETNVSTAFVYRTYDRGRDRFTQELTQVLGEDYGHAFFYVTLSDVVQVFFSFGPNGPPKKESVRSSQRQGSADYLIKEKCTFYRMAVPQKQAQSIIAEANKVRAEITSGRQKYTAYVNDTCAETAYDILKPYILNLPSGTGPIDPKRAVPTIWAINPYMWQHNFSQSIFARNKIVYPSPYKVDGLTILQSGGRKVLPWWMLKVGDKDPLVSEGYV